MDAIYDDIGIGYAVKRGTDPKIAQQFYPELQGATRILNIGAGTGSYEPDGVALIAVEPSSEMLSQRRPDSYPAVQAGAENLPFESNSFSHAMTVLSMHHWRDRESAFREINRVASERFVAVTWGPDVLPFWLTRDYFPEIYAEDIQIFPDLAEFERHFDDVEMKPLPIPQDCVDGFLAAFWKRPHYYLNEDIRRSMSSFSKIERLDEGLQQLRSDLDSGHWHEINSDILGESAIDAGYRIVTAKIKKKP